MPNFTGSERLKVAPVVTDCRVRYRNMYRQMYRYFHRYGTYGTPTVPEHVPV